MIHSCEMYTGSEIEHRLLGAPGLLTKGLLADTGFLLKGMDCSISGMRCVVQENTKITELWF